MSGGGGFSPLDGCVHLLRLFWAGRDSCTDGAQSSARAAMVVEIDLVRCRSGSARPRSGRWVTASTASPASRWGSVASNADRKKTVLERGVDLCIHGDVIVAEQAWRRSE